MLGEARQEDEKPLSRTEPLKYGITQIQVCYCLHSQLRSEILPGEKQDIKQHQIFSLMNWPHLEQSGEIQAYKCSQKLEVVVNGN